MFADQNDLKSVICAILSECDWSNATTARTGTKMLPAVILNEARLEQRDKSESRKIPRMMRMTMQTQGVFMKTRVSVVKHG